MQPANHELVDHNSLRTNQAVIISMLAVAYLGDAPLLIFICGSLMLIGSLLGKPAFLPVYYLLKQTGVIQPDLQPDHSQPHRFAQLIGAIVLLVSSLAFLMSANVIGWILTMVVVILAALNLFLGFCLGCTLYYWLARLGVPGFDKTPVEGAS